MIVYMVGIPGVCTQGTVFHQRHIVSVQSILL